MEEADIKKAPDECVCDTPDENIDEQTKKDFSDYVYSFLDAAEKLATALVKINSKLKKKKKKLRKKYKKYGKLNKKTGLVKLKKKPKKAKKAKFYKRAK